LPQDLSAEAAVLGSMIVDSRCIGEVVEYLDRSAFYHVENQYIFDAIVHLWTDNGETGVDGLLVRAELERRGRLEEIGGVEYLGRVLETVPSSANVGYYRDIVRERSLLRSLIATCTQTIEDAYDGTGDARGKLEAAEQRIFAVTDRSATGEAVATNDLVKQVYRSIESRKAGELTGLCTGYAELDTMTTGLQPGDLVLIAGRPSMGKTSLGMNIAENLGVTYSAPVAVFSLEMGKAALTERLMASNAGVNAHQVRLGLLDAAQYDRLSQAMGRIGAAPIYIDDTSALTPLLLRAKARRVKSRYGIKCIVIDYLQLMTMGPGWREGRQQEVTAISRQLKAMARELGVPVIALSQLNRAPEGRDDHRPRLSDLRESGALEQDADLILFLHREDYYHRNERDHTPDHQAELIIAKQRNGPTGTVPLLWRDECMRFENPARVPVSNNS
jgi:replicative DNA helicase